MFLVGYTKIEIKKVASRENLQKWEGHMMEKAKCWNKFCLGLYSENGIQAVHVEKEGQNTISYITTLCEDCIKTTADYGI